MASPTPTEDRPIYGQWRETALESEGTMVCRILVLEDDPIQQRLMRDVLRDEGHEVVVAGSLEAAQPELGQCDVIVTDLHMHGALLSLAGLLDASSAAVLVVSGHPDRQALSAAAGVPSLAKPFDIDEFVAEVEALCPSPALAQVSAAR